MTRGRRPYVRPELKKNQLGIKLPEWIIRWLRRQPESNAAIIEDALRRTHDLPPPADD